MPARMVFYVFAAVAFLSTATVAQTYTDVPRSEDQSFNGTVKVSSEEVSRRTSGFVRELEVSFKWAGFFGQPVESYALRWQMGEVIRQSGKPPLRRSDLEKYPDLLERFDDLKPTEIILNTQVLAYSAQLTPENWRDYQPNNYARSSNPYFAQGIKTISRVPHLVIRRSGELGTDIIPSSPKNTQSFIEWNYLPSGADAEEAASNTLNLADRLRVGTLAINQIEVPFAAIDRIQDEYLKREKEEAEEEEDDFWGDEEEGEPEEEPQENTSEDDDFWGDEDEQVEAQSKNTPNDDDFWACPDQSNDCWKKPEPKVTPAKGSASVDDTNGEIVVYFGREGREDDRHAVLNANGQVIIPFIDKRIYAYENGRARATQLITTDRFIVHGKHPYSCTEMVWLDGQIGKTGRWIGKPEKYYVMTTSGVMCGDGDNLVRSRIDRLRRDGTKSVHQLPTTRNYKWHDLPKTKGSESSGWYKRYIIEVREVTSLASQTFEIVKNDNREWGVRSSNGRMVIPFSKTLILSYRDGVAKVAKPTESKEYTCAVAKSGPFRGALQAWTSLDVWSEGLMDNDGNWIITPKKKGYFGISDRRCRKFLPEVRRYARSNNIELIEDFDEYVKIGGKLQW